MMKFCLSCGHEVDEVEGRASWMSLCRRCGFEWGINFNDGHMWYIWPIGTDPKEVPAGALAVFSQEELTQGEDNE